MTYLDHEPPSWAGPIAIGALFSFVGALLGVLLPGGCCCMPILAAPCGFLPAAAMTRRDPHASIAQGFAIAFIAVGIGSIAAAVIAWLQIDAAYLGDIEESVREMFREVQNGQPGQISDEEVDEMVDAVVAITPYLPVLSAGLLSICSGLVGMVTVGLLRPRQRS